MSRTMSRTRATKLATLDVVDEIARHVPGYRGYQEPAQRREDDRRFRTSVAEHLRSEAHRLEHIENRQFGEDFSDLLEEVDGGARRLEFLADAVSIPSAGAARPIDDDTAETTGRIDLQVVERIDRLHALVHELEKAYKHDEQFQMNLSELQDVSESISDLIEQRNVVLSR